MKRYNITHWLSESMTVAFVLGSLFLCRPVDAAIPFVVNLTFEKPWMVSLGEPLIGYYTITNTSDRDLFCWVGGQANGCLALSDSAYGNQRSEDQSPALYTEANGERIRVPAVNNHSGTYTGYFVVNGWHEQGRHTLSLTVHFTYRVVDDVNPTYPTHSDKDPAVNQVFEEKVTVLPMNTRHVRDVSESLRRAILNDKDYDHRQLFVTALFSMPGSVVHDCWARLISDPRTRNIEQDSIAYRLALQPSAETADLLAQQIWSHPSLCSYIFIPQDALANMYNNGDTALRQHIRDLYAQHGVQVAGKIDIPQIGD